LLQHQHDDVDDDDQGEHQEGIGPRPRDGGHGGPATVGDGKADAGGFQHGLSSGGNGAGHEVDQHGHAGKGNAQGDTGRNGVHDLHADDQTSDDDDDGDKYSGSEA